MAYNAAERKDVRRAEKEARFAERQRQEIITNLMSTMAGRSWVLEKLEECHIFATSFNRDPCAMAYMEGERSIGLKLLNDIMRSCPDQYILMMRERNQRDAARSATSNERSGSSNGDGSVDGSTDTPDSTAEGGDNDSAADATVN